MKSYILLQLLLAAVTIAAGLSVECQYVDSNRLLSDVEKVKKCFNSYSIDLSSHLIDTIIFNLEIIGEMYPYVDIALNPPSDPPGYFKVVNYTAGLEDLKSQLKRSDGVISKVFKPTVKFINSFRDGHFYISLSENAVAGGIFSPVVAVLPFTWDPVIEDKKRRVFIKPSTLTDEFIPGGSDVLQEKFNSGVYATKVDDRDAFEFFANFLGDYNEMKSQQGSLLNSMLTSNNGFMLLLYPLDDAFDKHTITFSDGTKFAYNLGFVNKKNPASLTRADTWNMKNLKIDESAINETEILEAMKNFEKVNREKRDTHTFVECGRIGDMNYVSIPTFSPSSTSLFLMELVECIEEFDENDKPITVILPVNGGGSASLRELVQFLLMPTSDSRTLRAARKTKMTKYLGVDKGIAVMTDFEKCETLTNYEVSQFWKETEYDDYDNGIIHSRTKKFVESFRDSFYPLAQHCLKKHVRKPTEIILATDGYCFSACAFFVDNCIRSGSAIVAGYGITMPGDEQFVAAQCPSRVIGPADYIEDLGSVNNMFGITFKSTFLESYNFSEEMKEIIPADYDILRIDKHCGYNKNLEPVFTDLLKRTTAVYEEFKTKCNPANKRLLLVTDECRSRDKNALYSGYVCGSNGEWDKDTCRISGCKPGYVVDFDQNKCVPNPCDPRSASSVLYPMVGVLLSALAITLQSVL